MEIFKSYYVKIFLIFTIIIIIFMWDRYSPTGIRMEGELKNELVNIQILPGATLKNIETKRKGARVLVTGNYLTEASYNEIRQYYDKELSRNGWRITNEKDVMSWWTEYEGKSVSYKKGEATAVLYYPRAGYNYTYCIHLSWGFR